MTKDKGILHPMKLKSFIALIARKNEVQKIKILLMVLSKFKKVFKIHKKIKFQTLPATCKNMTF